MDYEIIIEGDQVLIKLSGNVWYENAPAIRELLLGHIESGYKKIIVDLEDLCYIDNNGLGILITSHKLALRLGSSFIIRSPRGVIKDLFTLTRLDKMLEIQE